ncbi:hypothetical protein ACS0TY_009318 [Phlomoides rotata]
MEKLIGLFLCKCQKCIELKLGTDEPLLVIVRYLQACKLNLSEFPYKPTGGCINIHEELEKWKGFPLTSCCQNALLAFAHALALRSSRDSSGAIFMPPDQWTDCSGPFRVQPNVSVQTCGFQDFFYGKGKCSILQLESIDKNVVDHCSNFAYSSFDDACGRCTSAISNEVTRLLAYLGVVGNDHVEEAICGVAVIVSVLEGTMNRTARNGSDDLIRCLPALATPTDSKNYIKLKNSVAEALIAVILVIVVLIAITVLIKHVEKMNKVEKKQFLPKEIATKCSGLYRFSKAEIERAINYTIEKQYLGRGSAGQVYMGMLPSGQFVAIKQLFQGITSDSFAREIDGLSRVRHPNLVCLFGCCIADGQQFLVYEYCPNGNLAHHLLKSECVLTWKLRVKILRDCAAALKHLHQHISGCIVHRDIKLTNILLDQDMEPKLSDFGLSKMLGLLSGQRVIQFDLDARDQLTRKVVCHIARLHLRANVYLILRQKM